MSGEPEERGEREESESMEWEMPDLDDVAEAFLGSLLAGMVLIFVVLPLARRFGFRPWRSR